jgi:DNA-binding transcriptional LysR family regulator
LQAGVRGSIPAGSIAVCRRPGRTCGPPAASTTRCLLSGELFRVAASQTVADFVLPSLLAGFRHATPGVRFSLDAANTDAVVRAVRERTVDVGVVAGLLPGSDLVSLTLCYDELVVAVSAARRWANADSVDTAQLASLPFFTREPGSGIRAVAIDAARALGAELQPAVEVASTAVLKRLVEAGDAFTIISSLAIEDERRSGALRALHLNGADLRRPIQALRSPEAPPAAPGDRFWRWLRTAAPLGDHARS